MVKVQQVLQVNVVHPVQPAVLDSQVAKDVLEIAAVLELQVVEVGVA